MPNWCECDLTVSGPRKSVDKFLSMASKTEEGKTCPFQLGSFLPVPACLSEVEAGSSEHFHSALYGDFAASRERLAGWGYEVTNAEEALSKTAQHFGKSLKEAISKANAYERNLRETGHKTWYDWCVANWGVKWDLSDVGEWARHERGGECEAEIQFQTPWGPPSEGMASISKMFPDLSFRLEYFECGMGFQGMQTFVGGEVEEFSSSDYDGDRGG